MKTKKELPATPWVRRGESYADANGNFPFIKPNGDFILRSVNNHEELIQHLRDANAVIADLAGRYGHTLEQYSPMIKRIDAALARAEGGK